MEGYQVVMQHRATLWERFRMVELVARAAWSTPERWPAVWMIARYVLRPDAQAAYYVKTAP